MPGPVPGIHVFGLDTLKTQMAGTSPAMTKNSEAKVAASQYCVPAFGPDDATWAANGAVLLCGASTTTMVPILTRL